MAQNSKNLLLVRIRDLIKETFDKEEVRSLCFELGIKYDDLRGETLSPRIESLVSRMNREGRSDDLLNFCAYKRPKIEWPDLSEAVTLDAVPTPFTIPKRNPRQIFLGHARQDADFAHQLAADLRRHDWEQVQKLGAAVAAQYPDYRETETLMAMAAREEDRERRQQAESLAQERQAEAEAERQRTEAAQLYTRLRTAIDRANWAAALTWLNKLRRCCPATGT